MSSGTKFRDRIPGPDSRTGFRDRIPGPDSGPRRESSGGVRDRNGGPESGPGSRPESASALSTPESRAASIAVAGVWLVRVIKLDLKKCRAGRHMYDAVRVSMVLSVTSVLTELPLALGSRTPLTLKSLNCLHRREGGRRGHTGGGKRIGGARGQQSQEWRWRGTRQWRRSCGCAKRTWSEHGSTSMI